MPNEPEVQTEQQPDDVQVVFQNEKGELVSSEPGKPEEPAPEAPSEEPAKEPEKAEEPEAPKEEEKAAPEEEAEAKPEEEPKEKKGPWQARVDRLTEEKYRLRAEVEQLRRAQGQPPAPPPELKPEPKEEDYEDWKDYLAALVDYKADRKLAEFQAKAAESERNQEAKRIFDAHQRRLLDAQKKYEDWDEVVQQSDIELPLGALNAIVNLENGPDVSYYLAKHPEVCEEMQGMGDVRAAVEIGKISAELSGAEKKPASATTPPTPKPPPPPIKPVGSAPTKGKLALDDPNLPPEEYISRMNAAEEAKRES